MTRVLRAGAARRVVNPPLGTGKFGLRLFGTPIQAIESDLTATILVLRGDETAVAVVALDLCLLTVGEASRLRASVADALRIPVEHVLLNLSHNHSAPALPEFMEATDSDEERRLRRRYEDSLQSWLAAAAREADQNLTPARIGCAWGSSSIGVYRREMRSGGDVLGEVPDHPIDPTVGVIRVDDLDGSPIAVLFRYSAHPVTVGSRSHVASADFPGPARDVVERNLGGLALFLQGCCGNINPRVGIGYEIDCSDTKNRVGMELGGEVLRVAATIRTNTRRGPRRQLGNVPNILVTPWEPIDGETPFELSATETRLALDFDGLPSTEVARATRDRWEAEAERLMESEAAEWQVRTSLRYTDWAKKLVDATEAEHPTHELRLQVIRINDIVLVGMSMEIFFETGLEIRARAPFANTFVLGYTNGCNGYLPRAEDYPADGWKFDASYAVPDLIPQQWGIPVILRPDSERRVVQASLDAIAHA